MEKGRINSIQVSHGQFLTWNKGSQFDVYMRQTFQKIMNQKAEDLLTIG